MPWSVWIRAFFLGKNNVEIIVLFSFFDIGILDF